jgi:hypothetical protein
MLRFLGFLVFQEREREREREREKERERERERGERGEREREEQRGRGRGRECRERNALAKFPSLSRSTKSSNCIFEHTGASSVASCTQRERTWTRSKSQGREKRVAKRRKHGEQDAASAAAAASASPSTLFFIATSICLTFALELAFFASGERRHNHLAKSRTGTGSWRVLRGHGESERERGFSPSFFRNR